MKNLNEVPGPEPGRDETRGCGFCNRKFNTEEEFRKHNCPPRRPVILQSQTGSGSKRSEWVPTIHLLRFIYTRNPFYIISACLVLLGLNTAFSTSSESVSAWILLGVLAGYTCLIALAAILIVRLGKVWQDARSILIIVAVLFVALSMSLDEIAIPRGHWGTALLYWGAISFIMALVISFAKGGIFWRMLAGIESLWSRLLPREREMSRPPGGRR